MMAYVRRKPALYRLARALRWTSILALLLVILFLISVFYSIFVFATQGSVQIPQNGGLQVQAAAATGFQATLAVNISNPSMYALDVDITAVLGQMSGPLLGRGSSGTVNIAPGGQPIPLVLSFTVPSSVLQARGAALLTQNLPLFGAIWVNGSYATVFTFGAHLKANATWGAPFHGLTVTPGTPSISGGSATVPVAFNFTDDAIFPDTGTLSFQVVNSGTPCGSPTQVPLNAQPHQNYTGQANITGPTSCMTPGATVETTYTLGSLVIALPPETLP